MLAMENDSHSESGDYSRFGIPDAPRTTVSTPFGKVKEDLTFIVSVRLSLKGY